MNAPVWILALVLAVPAPAVAEDKKDDKGKKDAKGAEKPGSPEDLMKQAAAKEAAGDLDGAAELMAKVAATSPSGDPSLRLGRLLDAKGDLDKAMDAYKAAADKLTGASKGEALGRLAVVQEIRGDSAAGATAEAAATADAAGTWPAIALSRARARAGKGDEAVALAQKAEAAGGGASAAWALGYAQEARGDMAAAETAYRASLAAEAGRVGPSVGLARVLRKTGRAAEAEPILLKAIEVAPGAVEAYKESARVKIALDRAAEAMGDASIAAAMAENDSEAQKLVQQVTVAKALGYLKTNEGELAVQDLTALRDANPSLAEARVGLAKALVATRRVDAAIVELQKAVELDPATAENHYQLAYAQHVLKGNAAAALPSYEKAVAAEPSNVTYRTNMGAALSGNKQFDRAVEELGKVTSTPGYNRADAWIFLGEAHLGAKRYKDAIPALDKALTITPNSAPAEAYLGWCYFGLKDASNFKKHAGRAKELGHKEPTLLQYLSRIEAGEPIK